MTATPTDSIRLTEELVRYRSTPELPQVRLQCLQHCADYMAQHVPQAHVHYLESSGHPSLLITTQQTMTPDILWLGHIDTLDGDDHLFEPRTENGRLYGRATLDMKAFVATSVVSFAIAAQQTPHASLGLLIVSDEELGGAHGAGYTSSTLGLRPRIVLNPDSGQEITSIVTDCKHILHVRVAAEGKEAHGARPWLGDSAIDKLLRTYARIRQLHPAITATPDDIWITTLNAGRIGGGTAVNEVPKEAWIDLDFRLVAPTTPADIYRQLDSCMEPGTSYETRMEGYPVHIETTGSAFALYQAAAEHIVGQPLKTKKTGGGTDGRYFAHAGSEVIIHQGTGGNIQQDDEYVEIASLTQLVDIHTTFVYRWYQEQQ